MFWLLRTRVPFLPRDFLCLLIFGPMCWRLRPGPVSRWSLFSCLCCWWYLLNAPDCSFCPHTGYSARPCILVYFPVVNWPLWVAAAWPGQRTRAGQPRSPWWDAEMLTSEETPSHGQQSNRGDIMGNYKFTLLSGISLWKNIFGHNSAQFCHITCPSGLNCPPDPLPASPLSIPGHWGCPGCWGQGARPGRPSWSRGRH